ncbi:MAG: Ig-like domain-containing protein, partial [Marinifilaceae bacterium]
MKKVLLAFVSILLIAMCSCKDDENLVIAVSSIKINQAELSIKVDSIKQLSFTILPINAPDKSVTWESGNPEIASVSEKGLVTGIKEGSTIITVSTKNGKTSELKVDVSSNIILAESITIDKTEISLKEGKTQTIVAKILPANTTDKTLVWSTSNKLIATVDKGVITGVKEGSTIITVSTKNGKTSKIKVNVLSVIIIAESVTIDKKEVSLNEGDTQTIVAKILPANTTDKTLVWSTS